jgi:Cu-processing system ATP-binding protein
MIEVRGVSKNFGRLEVLRELSLSIAPNRITALIGPNASGKTTLAKIILGLARPDHGSVEVAGCSVAAGDDYRRQIGYMPQLARFPENLSARELLAMLSDLRKFSQPLDEDLQERFAFGAELNKPLRTLSGGTRQKVNAMIAFLFKPDLLILDEPTAGLDPVASGVLKDKILREKGLGKTFLLTSHIMSELEELADDVAFINEGRVAFTGSQSELKRLTRQSNLERAIAEIMKRGVAA